MSRTTGLDYSEYSHYFTALFNVHRGHHNLVGYPVTPRGGIMNVTVAQPGVEPGSPGPSPYLKECISPL